MTRKAYYSYDFVYWELCFYCILYYSAAPAIALVVSERYSSGKYMTTGNANSRADCLVGLLVRAVEELAESNEIKDSRRLATASFQVQQTAIKYRSTVAYLAKNPEAVLRIDTKQCKVADVSPGKTFSVATKGGSDCAPARNVHCPVCRVCPYSWTCTSLDNRTGITCMHRHAVTVNEGPTPSTTVGEPQEALAACDVESGTATADLKAVDFDIAVQHDLMIPEAECLKIVDEVLSKLDIGEFHVKLNHRFVLEGMFTPCDAGADQFKKICSFTMDKLDKKSWVEVFTATPSTSLRMSWC
ncbi:unnamed protein product [Nippostrongylus brasiliensis]|uniref:SWIM-type domain-containing protein n=1 Tax=Nippostrongylus brasiliensis TaxID=27835 RepID=A0A0N4YBS1_NIPBR|nr:unnamed protein product [Nippostrongylus brasiliensis]